MQNALLKNLAERRDYLSFNVNRLGNMDIEQLFIEDQAVARKLD